MKKIDFKTLNYEKTYYFMSAFILVMALNILQIKYFNVGNIFFSLVKLLITVGFVVSLQMFVSSLFNNKLVGVYITNILLLVLGVASYIKMFQTSLPLLPSSFSLASQLGRISEFIRIPWSFSFVLGCVIIALNIAIYTFLWITKHEKVKFNAKKYGISFLKSFVVFYLVFYLMCFNTFVKKCVFPLIDCNITVSDSATDYKKNGLILSFFPRLGDMNVEVPKNYSADNLNKIKSNWENKEFGALENLDGVNVIAIQSESLWDPMRLKNVEYSVDPLSYIRNIEGKNGHFGKFITPSFGCNTCIPEFEFLTSVSTVFLPEGGYPYSQFLKKPVTSLAKVFKDNGYETTAIHTYDKEYYGRTTAYPMMGFDEILGDVDFEKPVIKGSYISDMYMADEIIKKFEEKKSPAFIYAISMQNHGDYKKERYNNYDITLKAPTLNDDELRELKITTQGVYDADKSFEYLTKYFENKDEKVIIVMYGDHLPFLGDDSSVYTKLGFMKNTTLKDNPNVFETPYVIWANYDISSVNIESIVGPQYLGLNTLKLAGIGDVPWQYKFFDEFYKKYTVYQYGFAYDQNGNKIDTNVVDKKLLEEYKTIQYNMLFE